VSELWFESAADLLAETDPGPTPFLVEGLIVENAIAVVVGPPKLGKTWLLLDLAIAVATGEKALGRFTVPQAGPVLIVLEESGRAALHRRLDKMVRGRALAPESLGEFFFAANRRVRLNDDAWRKRLLEVASARPWRLIAFDPFARVKGAEVEENSQREIGPVLDFLRELRDASSAAVAYVHHTPHDGTRQRGSSDLESHWESKLTLLDDDGVVLRAEHREAEAVGPLRVRATFDRATETLCLCVPVDERVERIEDYIREHPDASNSKIAKAVGGKYQAVLREVAEVRDRLSAGGSSRPGNQREPPLVDLPDGGGSPDPLSPRRGEGSGTTDAAGGSGDGNPPPLNGKPLLGDEGYLELMFAAYEKGLVTEDEWGQAESAHRFVVAVKSVP
jgi:hypothetical protein